MAERSERQKRVSTRKKADTHPWSEGSNAALSGTVADRSPSWSLAGSSCSPDGLTLSPEPPVYPASGLVRWRVFLLLPSFDLLPLPFFVIYFPSLTICGCVMWVSIWCLSFNLAQNCKRKSLKCIIFFSLFFPVVSSFDIHRRIQSYSLLVFIVILQLFSPLSIFLPFILFCTSWYVRRHMGILKSDIKKWLQVELSSILFSANMIILRYYNLLRSRISFPVTFSCHRESLFMRVIWRVSFSVRRLGLESS